MKRFAVYARQSVDKKDSISIDTQITECMRVVGENPFQTYVDKGYSGKNTDRPQFQAMMKDIEEGKIDCVVVYKLDRISRSILDFANMTAIFEKCKVSFISCNESFDTSTVFGKAMLNICMVFAQLERETIQQRVTDAYRDRSKQGFYMGGKAPYGFEIVDVVIKGIHTKMYRENPAESAHIRKMFQMYADPSVSLGDIVRYFSENGIEHLKGSHWSTSRISDFLRNPVYVRADADVYEYFRSQGTTVISEPELFDGKHGCYLYQERKGSTGHKNRSRLDNKYLVIAPHEGLISSAEWLKCRKRCGKNIALAQSSTASLSWLLGKVKCGNCHSRLDLVRSQAKMGRYFLCGLMRDSKQADCKGTGSTLYADVLEQEIAARIKEKLQTFPELYPQQEEVDSEYSLELNMLKNELQKLENEKEALLEKILLANESTMKIINKKAESLEQAESKIREKIQNLKKPVQAAVVEKVSNMAAHWDDLSFDDKRAVLDILIEVIYVQNGEITVKWNI